MRIRSYPAVAFAALILISAYIGLAPNTVPSWKQSDKVLHFIVFFLLTLCFYWILETNKRRTLQLTLFVCTFGLSVGSEIVQALLPNGREFDPFDVVCNVAGSGSAIAICLWYHKRMLERKRQSKSFTLVGEADDFDIELGDGLGRQEEGVIRNQTLEQELDNWDENAEDWDHDDPTGTETDGEPSKTPTSSVEDGIDTKKT